MAAQSPLDRETHLRAAELRRRGIAHCEGGDVQQGLELLREALRLRPDWAAAHADLAQALSLLSLHQEALQSLEQALRLAPQAAQLHFARANTLSALGRAQEAVQGYEQAIARQGAYPEAYNNLGLALAVLGRHREALQSYEQALRLNGQYVRAHNNRGLALAALGRDGEALQSYERVLALQPRHFGAHANRAESLCALQRVQEALDSYEQALQLQPDSVVVLLGQARALRKLNRPEQALSCCERAVALSPDSIEALLEEGATLFSLRRISDAHAVFERILRLDPASREALYNRGLLLSEQGFLQQGIEDFERVLALQPDHFLAQYARGMNLSLLGQHDAAAEGFGRGLNAALKSGAAAQIARLRAAELHARAMICSWDGFTERVAAVVDAVRAGACVSPFFFVCFSDDPADQRRCAEAMSSTHYRTSAQALSSGERHARERIRVAYACGEFREHAVPWLLAGLFEHHERSRFEVIGVSLAPAAADDRMRLRLRRAFDRFVDLDSKSAVEAAQTLRNLDIDIAVDLNGYSGAGRVDLFAHRMAPIQVSYLGYPGTMGAPFVDYMLADRLLIPAGHEKHYSERIVLLSDTYQINDDQLLLPEATPTRTTLGLPEDGFVFCSFNNSYKLTPQMFDIWMALLRDVQDSVLWLSAPLPTAQANLRQTASRRGIDPRRLVFAAHVASHEEHLARQRQADLALDTLPYNAHTTASDALRAGLPVITCLGSTFAGRVCASVLRAAGLEELITYSAAEYAGLGRALAQDQVRLAALRDKIRTSVTRSALFDTNRACRQIERAYVAMWERWQRGEPPVSFSVEPE
jgi:predicted O-linked N-acetylglucosamine transferase (SPINDLY family)